MERLVLRGLERLSAFLEGGERDLGICRKAEPISIRKERPETAGHTKKWSSYKGCMVDALAPRGEDGRGVAAKSSGELLTKRGPRDLLTGKPGGGHAPSFTAESIGREGRPGELKHLSTPRKGKKAIDCVSSGERKRKSPNLLHVSLQALCRGGCESLVGVCRAPGEWKKKPLAEPSGKLDQSG